MNEMVSALGDRLLHARLGEFAAQALLADFARTPGPKHAIMLGGGSGSAVLTAAIDALGGDDTLTVVAGAAADDVRAVVESTGGWARDRVRVVDTLAEADPADAIIIADLVTGEADEVRGEIDTVAKQLNPGGVLCAAVAAAPFLARGAGDELERQTALAGIGCDLVLRNVPPVKIHRLRFTPVPVSLADRLTPMRRTSSVKITEAMHVDSNGIAAAGLCVAAAVAARRARPGTKTWLIPALAALPVAAFFRDPHRRVPDDATAIVAASDGKVLSVEQVHDERLGDGEFLRIAVFLSVLDVHINRAPVAGKVADYFVVDGGYAAAMKPEAEHNVAAYTVLETSRGTVAVAQRTGLIARRIVHRAPVGSLLAKGERFGLIRFGSRTDVYLPANRTKAEVSQGDRVAGGETIIARWI